MVPDSQVAGGASRVSVAGLSPSVGRRGAPPLRWLAIVLIAVFLGALALSALPGTGRGGDSARLVQGTRAALDCIGDGSLLRCGYPTPPGRPITEVFAFPLLQYLPSAALIIAGFDDDGVLWGLVVVSLMAFVATLAMVDRAGRRLPSGLGPLLVAVTFLSPLIIYAILPFGEMLATSLVLAAVVAAIHRRPWATAVLVGAACLGKETLFPFVIVLTLAAGRDAHDGWLPPRRLTTAVLGGALCAVLASVAFNLFRFGSPRNLVYLRPELRTDGLDNTANFLAAVWVAPAGGIAWFWPAAVIALAATGAAGVSLAIRGRGGWAAAAGPLAVVLTFVAFTVGLATWFSPLGWIAWGPRLALPIVPGALVAGAWAGRGPLGRWADTVLRPLPAALLIAVGLAVVGWPHAGVGWTQEQAVAATLGATPGCPAVTELHVQSRPDQYFRCLRRAMWRIDPNPLATASTGGGLGANIARGAGAAAAIALVLSARATVRTA